VATLLLAFVSFDVREAQFSRAMRITSAVPLPKATEEVAKRIDHFGLDGEHPRLTRADWMRAIAADQTQDSYWEWVTENEIMLDRLLRLADTHPK